MAKTCAWITSALCATGMIALANLPACATPRINTTMLDANDIVAMTDAMLVSFARDARITARTPASPVWVFTLDRVENRTEHLMSRDERWAIMARLRAKLAESALAKERAIIFILPGEEWQRLEPAQPAANARLAPTHALRATFWSDTRTSQLRRADTYLCTFRLSELDTGVIVWEDAFEFEHAIARNALD